VCWICGAEHAQKHIDGDSVVAEGWQDATKHKDWCENIARRIYDRFNSTFREIYNVIELSLPDEKAKIAKDLIGNKIMETRNDSIEFVRRFHLTDKEWQDSQPVRK